MTRFICSLMTRFICSQSVGLRLARKWLSEPQIARRCFACAVMSQLLYAFASDLWVCGRRLIAADCGPMSELIGPDDDRL